MVQSAQRETGRAFQERIQMVRDQIESAARVSGRDVDAIRLIAVSKTVDRAAVDLAYELGLRDFGENRVQDAVAKFADGVPDDLQLHLIGALQTNKVNQVLGRFSLVHSLDRPSLATAIDKRAQRDGIVQPVLLQVNVGREDQKHGCAVEDVPELVEQVLGLEGLRLDGFMTMAPFTATAEQARPVFVEIREIAERMRERFEGHPLPELSMGMTNDYVVAIEEGATMVRVGRAIFQDEVS